MNIQTENEKAIILHRSGFALRPSDLERLEQMSMSKSRQRTIILDDHFENKVVVLDDTVFLFSTVLLRDSDLIQREHEFASKLGRNVVIINGQYSAHFI